MPFGDGTGPRGMGPMTGRREGFCAGFPAPGFANPISRVGIGWPHRYSGVAGYRRFPPYAGFGQSYYGGAYGLPPRIPAWTVAVPTLLMVRTLLRSGEDDATVGQKAVCV